MVNSMRSKLLMAAALSEILTGGAAHAHEPKAAWPAQGQDPPQQSSRAQQQQDGFVYTNVLGDVTSAKSPNPGRLHVFGSLLALTSDYFRAAFDNVPEELETITFGPNLSLVFELLSDSEGFLRDISLTAGTTNNFAPETRPRSDDWWYESDNYIALAARFRGGWLAGLTYTVFSVPNDIAETVDELAFAVSYTGDTLIGKLSPQLKIIARPTDEPEDPEGILTQLVVTPSVKVREGTDYPITFSVPLTLGIGFDDYYGRGTDTSIYGAISPTASVPLAFIPSDFGNWTFSVGADVWIREDDIAEAAPKLSDDDTIVTRGRAAISFVY